MSTATAIDLKEDIWTYEDYLHLPNDGKTYQVIGGELFMAPAPLVYHQTLSRNLAFIIWNFVKKHDLGEVFFAPVDIIFSQINVTQPDIIYIAKERLGIKKEKGIFGAPDWIIEILSPSTSNLDLRMKKQLYQSFGVREYWIVDSSEKKLQVYFLKGGSYTVKEVYFQTDVVEVKTIKGLKINLAEVF
ncbi:MAG: Uma2 family endonuclease [bacterium]